MSKLYHPSDYLDIPKVTTDRDEAKAILEDYAATSRRSFLGRGLAAAAVPAAVLAGSSSSKAATSTKIDGPFPSFTATSTATAFREITFDEASHVNIISSAITLLGGKPRPYPTFVNLAGTSPADFLTKSIAFENTGVHAYFGAAPAIFNPQVVGIGLSIALVEAYHSGFLNNLGSQGLIPGGLPYATPFTVPQVLAAAGPYVSSLNDNGAFPAGFSSTPSAANDIAILNFALILELLEATFYAINVPKYF